MTAVPPPVPPEIVEKAAKALAWHFWGGGRTTGTDRAYAAVAIAAVYGDIVEAARRDALTEAAEAIRALDNSDDPWIRQGARTAARIVTGLRDATAPPRTLSATVSDQQPESGSGAGSAS